MKVLFWTACFALVVNLGLSSQAVSQTMAEPAPDFDNPRMVVVSLNEKDEKRVNAVLNNIMNIQKAYGRDNVKLAMVAYGPGIWAVLKDSQSAVASKACCCTRSSSWLAAIRWIRFTRPKRR